MFDDLLRPAAYPHPAGEVERRQTHISVVFLAGEWAYKLKKPVDFGFVDFSTLARRRFFCHEEVRLNRRLAPAVYLGVVPVTRGPDGLRIGGDGEAIEWAVRMVRLPERDKLKEKLLRGELARPEVEAVAGRIAEFHARAEAGPEVAAAGRFEVVAGNARDNIQAGRAHVGLTVIPEVLARVEAVQEEALGRLAPLIADRAARGVPRDGHGDLHLDHIYERPGLASPDDLAIIDCIEFNPALRRADPVADIAFLIMDLAFRGRPDLARAAADAWFTASGDGEGRALLDLYVAYRSLVRAKVDGLAALAPDLPPGERAGLVERGRAHWLFALATLAPPAARPALVLVGGLPGTGKSTLARALGETAGFVVIRSDEVRKALAGLAPSVPAAADFGSGIYSEEWTERTYSACLERAEAVVAGGGRALVDASFGDERRRSAFLDAARRLGVPGLLLECQAPREVVRARLAARRGDTSDADFAIHEASAARALPLSAATARLARPVPTGGSRDSALAAARAALAECGLM